MKLCKSHQIIDFVIVSIFVFFSFKGILKKWQLIFYGTATNPIRIRTRQINPVQPQTNYPIFPIDHSVELYRLIGNDYYRSSGFQNYPGQYTGAASNVQASVASLDGSSASILSNRLPGDIVDDVSRNLQGSLDPSRRIVHDCDPQCDHQGCYDKGPTECVACKTYRLDKWVFLTFFSGVRRWVTYQIIIFS